MVLLICGGLRLSNFLADAHVDFLSQMIPDWPILLVMFPFSVSTHQRKHTNNHAEHSINSIETIY
jgi:hypothetical protein